MEKESKVDHLRPVVNNRLADLHLWNNNDNGSVNLTNRCSNCGSTMKQRSSSSSCSENPDDQELIRKKNEMKLHPISIPVYKKKKMKLHPISIPSSSSFGKSNSSSLTIRCSECGSTVKRRFPSTCLENTNDHQELIRNKKKMKLSPISILSSSSFVDSNLNSSTYFGGSVVLLILSDEINAHIGSDTRVASITTSLITGKITGEKIAREEESVAWYPSLHREKVGKKIYESEHDHYIVGATGDAKVSQSICSKLRRFTAKKVEKGEEVTSMSLAKYIRDELQATLSTGNTFLLITPSESFEAGFTVRKITFYRSELVTDAYACIGCGREQAENYLLRNGPNSWRDKSAEEIRSLLRDCIYKSAQKHTLMIGGPIPVITFKVEEDTCGNRKLNADKKMIEFPPLTEVLTTTLGKEDIKCGLNISKVWFETYVSPNWQDQAKKEIKNSGGEVKTSMRFYPKLEDENFHKRPKRSRPESYKKYRMMLRNLQGNKNSFVLDFPKTGDFYEHCRRYKIKEGSKVHIFWDVQDATFTLWAD